MRTIRSLLPSLSKWSRVERRGVASSGSVLAAIDRTTSRRSSPLRPTPLTRRRASATSPIFASSDVRKRLVDARFAYPSLDHQLHCQLVSFKIQRTASGGDLPESGRLNPIPIFRRLNSFHAVAMDDAMESGNLGPYQERPRTFPNMRNKPYTPLVFRILMRINVRLLFVLLILGLGAIFYIGANTSPIIVFVLSVCIMSFLLSIYLTKWVLAKDEGPPEMAQISEAIRDGAEGFFRTQYGTISKMALLLALVILSIYLFRSTTPQQESSGLGR